MATAAAQLFVKVTAELGGLISGFRAAGDAAEGLGGKVDETAEAFKALAESDEALKRARMQAQLLGREFDETAEAVRNAERAVTDMVRRGLQPGNAALDEAVKRLKTARAAHEQATAATKQTTQATADFKSIVGGVAVGTLLADGLRATAGAMLEAGKASIKMAAEVEQNRVAFTTLLKDGQKAQLFLNDLAQFAAQTPFELRGLTDSAKRLLAFGFQAESIIPIMNAIGNAASGLGLGTDKINEITLALGQMAAKGKVSAEEMNQLAEKGIPAWDMLAKQIGVSTPQALKMAEKGMIDAATAIPAILNGMNKQFDGLMGKQSKTFSGALSNVQDSVDQAMAQIGDRIIKGFNLVPMLRSVSVAIGNLTAAFTSGGLLAAMDKAFGPTTKALIVGLGAAVTAALIPALGSAITSLVATAAAAAPFLAVAAAVAFAAYPIIKNWEGIKGTITALWDTAAQYTSAYYNRAVTMLNKLANDFTFAFMYIGDMVRSILGDALTDKLIGGIKRAAGAFQGLAQVAVTPLKVIGSVASAAADNFAQTWKDAMSASKGFTSGLFTEAAGSARTFGKEITASLLGLKTAGKDATAAASGAAKALKEKAAAAKKVAAETERMHAAGTRAYERFEAMAAALGGLTKALAEAEANERELGKGFDLGKAQIEAYKDAIPKVESAFGKFSEQAKRARLELEALQVKARVQLGAEIMDQAVASMDEARAEAVALGKEFDALAVSLQFAEEAMRKLVREGFKPGDEAYDKQIQKLRDLQAQQKKIPLTFSETVKAITDGVGAFTTVGDSLGKLAGLFGIAIPDGVGNAAKAFKIAGEAITVTAAAVTALNAAWALLNGTITVSPIGWIAIGIGALVGVVALAVEGVRQWSEAQTKANEEMLNAADAAVEVGYAIASSNLEARVAQAEFAAMAESAKTSFDTVKKAAGDGLRQATLAFVAGAADYGEILRTKLREGIFQAVVDAIISKQMAAQFDDLIGQIVTAFNSGIDVGQAGLLKQLEEKVTKSVEDSAQLLQMVVKALGMVPGEVQRMADEAMGKARGIKDAMAGRNREALGAHLTNLQRGVERLRERGYHLADPNSEEGKRYSRAIEEANRAAADLRGMATGGLVTGPMVARLGEGGRDEAVLPLNESVYRQIGQGIAAARSGAPGMQIVVSYTGNGKWTREDAQGLGRLLVSELRAMGVRA